MVGILASYCVRQRLHSGEPAGPKNQLLSSGTPSPDAPAAGDGYTSITYLPFGQPAPSSNGDKAPREKLTVEIELSIANVQKNSVLAYSAMKPAILKAIDRAGEQDRIDALHRAASRRACL